jgi:hypothetical protein
MFITGWRQSATSIWYLNYSAGSTRVNSGYISLASGRHILIRLTLARKELLEQQYSLRSIILFANIDVSRHILVVDTSVLAKSNLDWREYLITVIFL